MFDLSDRVALVTGASGGIGSAIARLLHAHGATVAISGTKAEMLKELASELKERVHMFPCNLMDMDAVEKLPINVANVFGPIDILVNNAGIVRDSLFMRINDEDWQDVISVNLEAPFRLMRQCVREMIRKNWGRIVNISSIVGSLGNPGQGNYAASKAGLVGMTKSLALEVAKRGVTVNCVAPGFISTNMTSKLTDEQRSKIKASIPSGTIGTSSDVASAVLYLCSQEASYVTGHTLHVNGGMYMA